MAPLLDLFLEERQFVALRIERPQRQCSSARSALLRGLMGSADDRR
jgi:hypothetical protein